MGQKLQFSPVSLSVRDLYADHVALNCRSICVFNALKGYSVPDFLKSAWSENVHTDSVKCIWPFFLSQVFLITHHSNLAEF